MVQDAFDCWAATDLVPLSEAPALFPESLRPSVKALYRWANEGLHPVDRTRRRKVRVRLYAVRFGNSLCTTRQAIREFFEEINRRHEGRKED